MTTSTHPQATRASIQTMLGKACNMDGFEGVERFGNSDIIIVTDPPFNVGYHYGKYNDRIPQTEYIERVSGLLKHPTIMVNTPENICQICAHTGMTPDRVVSWVYNTMNRRQHRDIAFFNIKPDMRLVRQPYKNPTDKRVRKRIENGSHGAAIYDWWNIQQVKNVSREKTAHPCQMPLEVMLRTIGVIPKEFSEHIIVDPFCGSGTTLLAAQRFGYEFVGFDIDGEYVDITNRRLACDKGSDVNDGMRSTYVLQR